MNVSGISIFKTGLLLTAAAVLVSIYACTEVPQVRTSGSVPFGTEEGEPEVKVLIAEKNTLSVSVQGPFKVFGESETDQIYHNPKGLENTSFSAEGGVILSTVAKDPVSSMDIVLAGSGSQMIIDGDSFYDTVRFIAKGDILMAVNILPIERYLLGVVTGELGGSDYLEALKAQAVAARSFAVYEYKVRASQPFHVRRTTVSQVFLSKDKYPALVVRAVEQTRGIVMTFENKLIKAYYSSTCGGKTANIDDVWECLPQIPFTSVPCEDCSEGKYYTWQYHTTRSELRRKLKSAGFDVGAVRDVVIPENGRGSSGRVRVLKISIDDKSHNGQPIILSGIKFRHMMNRGEGENLKSTWFDVKVSGNDIQFSGRGYGHGVGMCQIGATTKARMGQTYAQILSYYYSGISLKKVY